MAAILDGNQNLIGESSILHRSGLVSASMKYLINGTLRPGKTREELIERLGDKPISDEAWELVRTGVVTDHGYKTGRRPGFIFVVEGDSEEAVRALISKVPIVQEGWFEVEVDPVSPFLSDLR